jgi:hypothetical protein
MFHSSSIPFRGLFIYFVLFTTLHPINAKTKAGGFLPEVLLHIVCPNTYRGPTVNK